MLVVSGFTVSLLAAWGLFEQAASAPTAEAKGVAYLAREVPRWSHENHCYSCHNNGDAARALYQAARAGFRFPRQALDETTRWLTRPQEWDHNGGAGPSSDKKLARVAFTTALAVAIEADRNLDRSSLIKAAERLSMDQAGDGSWPVEGEDATGSPATYGRVLATWLARVSLFMAQPHQFRGAIARADRWLLGRDVSTITDAAVILQAAAVCPPPENDKIRRHCLDFLGRAQGEDGGWGQFLKSPSEPFDTALVLISLSKCEPSPESIRTMTTRGRKFLIAEQQNDGSWIETTRPPGNISYAQRISTTGWATLALLATRPVSLVPGVDGKR